MRLGVRAMHASQAFSLPGCWRALLAARVATALGGVPGDFRPLVLQLMTIDGSIVIICTTFVEKGATRALRLSMGQFPYGPRGWADYRG